MNPETQGLAGQGQQGMDSIKEVVMMLMQGMSPDELIAQGVPQELVAAAMEMLNQQMQAEQQQPQAPAGLAGMATQRMM